MAQFLTQKSQIKIKGKVKNKLSKLQKDLLLPFIVEAKRIVFNKNSGSNGTLSKEEYSEEIPTAIENVIKNILEEIPYEEIINDTLNPKEGGEEEEDTGWLGSYGGISSPGSIRFHQNNLRKFLSAMLCYLTTNKKHNISLDQLVLLIQLIVYKTYFHEIFHHFSDIYGIISAGPVFPSRKTQKHYIFKTEEALAVAASRNVNGLFAIDGSVLIEHFFARAYQYTSLGYRDWTDFQSYKSFREGVKNYFKVHVKLQDPNFDYLEDLFEHQYVSLINNPYADIKVV